MAKIVNTPLDFVELGSPPSSPPAGYHRIYAKSDGYLYAIDSSGNELLLSTAVFTIPYLIDGGGSVITTGFKGGIYIPFGYKVLEWTMGSVDPANTSGSIVVDLYTDTHANFPPAAGDSITGSAKPTISSSNKAQSSTLTGWTITQGAGRWLFYKVDSVTSLLFVSLNIKCIRT